MSAMYVSTETFALISAHYARSEPRRLAEKRWWAAKDASLQEATRRAALSVHEDKMDRHQCRVGAVKLAICAAALAPIEAKLLEAADFRSLHKIVDDHLRTIHGVGDLTIYDIADRIALHRGHSPAEVYLHAGTRVGALEVLGSLPRGVKMLSKSAFAPWFRDHDERDIENMLCVYAGIFTLPPDKAQIALDRLDRKRRGRRC